MAERIDIIYRRHRIIAGDGPAGPAAMAYDNRTKVYESAGSTVVVVALDAAKRWVDDLLDGQRGQRRRACIGTRNEYLRGFQALSIGKHHQAMLRAHANAAGHTLTPTELANAVGYDFYEAANAYYGKLGRKIAEFLDLAPPPSERRCEPVWTRVLGGENDQQHEHGHWRRTMHEEAVGASRDLNMA